MDRLRDLFRRRRAVPAENCHVDPLLTQLGASLQQSAAKLDQAEAQFRRLQREAQPVLDRRDVIVRDGSRQP